MRRYDVIVLGVLRANGRRFSCSETNSIACHGAPGVSNTAGISLWAIDYTLQAATLGISEAFFHEGVGYKYNWVGTGSVVRHV